MRWIAKALLKDRWRNNSNNHMNMGAATAFETELIYHAQKTWWKCAYYGYQNGLGMIGPERGFVP